MLAPPIQRPITLFFSPITTTTATATIAQPRATHLTLKPVLIASPSVQGSMNQKKRQLPSTRNNIATKTTSTKQEDSHKQRSSNTTQVQPPPKKQKLDSESKKRVRLPLREGNTTTLVRSRVDSSIGLVGSNKQENAKSKQQDNPAPKNIETSAQSESETKLDTIAPSNRPPAGVPQEDQTLVNGQRNRDDNKRSLRSHDGGSRSKSELAQYFPNFDEIVNPEVKEKELLTPTTKLFITEEPLKNSTDPQFVLPTPVRTRAPSLTIATPVRPLPVFDYTFEKIELPPAEAGDEDPLADSYYEVAHRRAERSEKQFRNIEKERAQHEKVQLERLYEGLLGPDWLKVMGISGVTEGDRKKWDDARDYFIKEVKSLLDKFARWKEEERRRKLIEVQKRREAEEDDESEADDEDEERSPDPESSPDAAAHQLQVETLKASAGTKGKSTRVRKPSKRALEASPPPTARSSPVKKKPKSMPVQQYIPPVPLGPFTSFFAKPHQRAAAMDKNRRTGRTTWAFGHPIPEMDERPYELPRSIGSAEAVKASARLRRGLRRGRE